ncbi:MAG: ABC transporter substrate-binding protein [Fusobacteriota bacterium]
MKKGISLMLLGVLMSTVAFGGIFDVFSRDKESDEVLLTYARGKDSTEATVKIVERFNEIHEGEIKVVFREMPADTGAQHDAYVTSMSAGGSEYDVFDADVIWPAEFAQAEYALPLDRFMERDGIKKSDYMEGPMNALTFKGRVWGLPKFIDSGMLFYRKDIVDEAPETWEELMEMAAKYEGEKGTKYGYVAQAKQYEGLVCNAMELISAYGGEVVDGTGEITIDNPDTIQGMNKFIELLNKDFVPSNITSFTELESHTAFLEGQSVFIRNWPYQWALAQDEIQSKIAGKVGVAPLPKGDERSAATLGGWVTMINQHSENPEAAWEFLKFMNGPEGQEISAVYGGLAPTLKSVWDNTAVLRANPFFRNEGFKKGLEAAVPRPVSPIYPRLSDIMQIEISKAITGAQTPEEAVKNMDEKMKEAVEDSK